MRKRSAAPASGAASASMIRSIPSSRTTDLRKSVLDEQWRDRPVPATAASSPFSLNCNPSLYSCTMSLFSKLRNLFEEEEDAAAAEPDATAVPPQPAGAGGKTSTAAARAAARRRRKLDMRERLAAMIQPDGSVAGGIVKFISLFPIA